MGKTYTVDPISKRRLENRGEANKYYTKNHHEAIISEEIWDKVKDIRESRYRNNSNVSDVSRSKYARKYAFLDMFRLLAENFDDVLEAVLKSVEENVSKDDIASKIRRLEKEFVSLDKKKRN